jgi:hypothetical protein
MRRIRVCPPSPALVLASAALAVALGGAAWAAIPTAEGVIHGCYNKRSGQLRVIDTATHAKCGRREAELNWEEIGPPGPRGGGGARGATGPPGPTGPEGPSNAYVASQSGPATLSGTARGVLTLSLPAGKYVLSASVRIADEATETGVATCAIKGLPGPPTPEATATVQHVSGIQASETVPLDGAATLTAPATVELSCTQLSGTGSATTASQAQIDAVQVANLEGS